MYKSLRALVYEERKEDKLIKLLPKSMQSFQGDLKRMRLEMGSPKEVESRFSHGECEHAAKIHAAQGIQVPRAILRWTGGGKMPKRRTLSDLLQECESQTERFRDHTDFQEFCKIQVKKRKYQDVDIFLLSTFEGSPTCSAGAWVKELDSYL